MEKHPQKSQLVSELSNLEVCFLIDTLIEQLNKSSWKKHSLLPIDNYVLKIVLSRYFFGSVVLSKIIKTCLKTYNKQDIQDSLIKLQDLQIIFITKKTISGKQKSICLPNLAHPNIQQKTK